MPRGKKDYRVAPSPEPLIGNPGALLVNVVDADGKLECSFDFSIFADRPAMAAEWALAFRHHYAVRQPANRVSVYRNLKLWFAFLGEHYTSIAATRDVDTGVLNAFICRFPLRSDPVFPSRIDPGDGMSRRAGFGSSW